MRWGSQKDTRGKTGAWSCNFISCLPVSWPPRAEGGRSGCGVSPVTEGAKVGWPRQNPLASHFPG